MLYIFIHDIHVCKNTQQKRKTGFMLFSCKTSLNQISEACTNPRVQVLCVSLVEAFIYPKDWIGINSRLPPAILQRRKNHVIVDHCGLVRICIAKSAEILIFGWAMMDQNHEEYIKGTLGQRFGQHVLQVVCVGILSFTVWTPSKVRELDRKHMLNFTVLQGVKLAPLGRCFYTILHQKLWTKRWWEVII